MRIISTPFEGLLILEPKIYSDSRGYFYESWNENTFKQLGIDFHFVQDNQSCSAKDVIRGLHYQVSPYEQGKLVRVLYGSVLDVVVDLRKSQPTFGMHFKLELSAIKNNMMFIPPGFAHGFKSLEEDTLFFYKCTNVYNKESERAIRWDDPELAIDWEVKDPVLSEKDQQAPFFDKSLGEF